MPEVKSFRTLKTVEQERLEEFEMAAEGMKKAAGRMEAAVKSLIKNRINGVDEAAEIMMEAMERLNLSVKKLMELRNE